MRLAKHMRIVGSIVWGGLKRKESLRVRVRRDTFLLEMDRQAHSKQIKVLDKLVLRNNHPGANALLFTFPLTTFTF